MSSHFNNVVTTGNTGTKNVLMWKFALWYLFGIHYSDYGATNYSESKPMYALRERCPQQVL